MIHQIIKRKLGVLRVLERTLRLNSLYDFYQSLLTKKQREYMEMYYFDDFSLAEISEVANVSRQAIYDTLKRTEQLLESYEENLSLYKKHSERRKIIDQLKIEMQDNEKASKLLLQLQELS